MGNKLRRLSVLCSVLLFNVQCASSPSRSPASIPAQPKGLQLLWPVAKPKVSNDFTAGGWSGPHDGIDIPAPTGTRIYAPADGRVVYAGHKFRGYGRMIIIEHNSKVATIYGHCQKLLVKSGDYVKTGTLIGLVGRTGRATAPHLHFEIRIDRKPVDPMEYLP